MQRAVLFFAFFVLGVMQIKAQVSTNSGSGLAPTYTSLANAITALNAATITSPVVITLTGNETAPAGGYAITQLGGTFANTITIQGISSTLTAAASPAVGSRTDAVIKIIGGDYITIQNFTIIENPSNTVGGAIAAQQMTEFGIALFAASTTDGAQNNTIQNNTITLSSATAYQNAIGIFSTCASSSTNGAQSAASTAGTNSNNKIYGNTISGVAQGVYFIAPAQTATVFESGNDIGGSSAATGNTITYGISNTAGDLGFTSYSGTTPAGIYFRNVVGSSARFNTINSTTTLNLVTGGIFSANGTAPTGITYTTTFSNNTITITNVGTTAITGIDFGSGLSTGTIVGSNNVITINQISSAANSAAIIGIKANYASATNTINNNSVTINQSSSSGALSSVTTGITLAGASTTLNAGSNTITINQTGTGSSATITGAVTCLSIAGTATNNNCTGNSILVNQTTSVASGISNAITGILATSAASANLNITSNNSVTIKQAVTGSGSYGAGAIVYASINAAHGNVNVTNNLFNTTGSTIRSTGNLDVLLGGSSTITGLMNIKNNTVNIDRVASSGSVGFYTQTSISPNDPADSISSNLITITGLAGTTSATVINRLGGASAAIKNYCNNTINVSGTSTGSITGILYAYSSTVNAIGNSVTINTAAASVVGISGNSNSGAVTMTNNSLSLTSSSTSPTSMVGLSIAGAGAHSVSNNTFNSVNFSSIITGSPTISVIVMSVGTSANIFNNVINNVTVGAVTSSASPIVDGILISGGASINVFKNKIYGIVSNCTGLTGVVNGIRISGGGTTANTIYNNRIGSLSAPTSTNTDAIRGISVTSTSGTTTNNVYYNTILLSGAGGTNFGSSGIFHTASTTVTTAALNLRNNIVVNNCVANGTGLVVAYRRSVGTAGNLANYASTSNNNLFYAGTPSSSNLIYTDGTSSAQTLANYKSGAFTAGTIAPRDESSVSENPSFLSTVGSDVNFLKVSTSVATQIESGAITIAGYTDDFEGDLRNASTPDIGADEFAGIAADFTGPSITPGAIIYTCGGSNLSLNATITDASGVPTSGIGLPVLYWKINAGAFNSVTGAFASGSTYSFSNFASGIVAGDIVSYYIVAQDNTGVPNASVNPSAGASGLSTNPPSVSSAPTTPFTYTVPTSLSGTYSVGVSQTYATLTAAISAYNTSCLSGPVTFVLTDATYSTGETFPVTINANSFASATNILTIKPASTATITGSVASGALIKFNGADWVVFDGSNSGGTDRSLTIENTTTTTTGNAAIWLASAALGNGSRNNVIKNCIIQGNASTTTFSGIHVGGTATIGLTTAGSEINDGNTITNNLFRKTQYGVTMFGYAAASPDSNNVVSNNTFGTLSTGEGFSQFAINTDRQLNLIVSGNEVQNVTSSTNTGTYGGIRLLDFKNGKCFNNSIHDLSYTGTSTPKIYGIAVTSSTYTTAGNPSNALVYNNMVSKINSTGTSTVWNLTGILASAGYGDRFYHNTVNLTGQLANSSSGLAAAFANGDGNITSVCTNIDVRDNIFVIAGSSAITGGNFWAYYSAAITLSGSTLNYNDLVANSTNVTNNIGRFNSTNYATLAAWQTATAQEANSVNILPVFTSSSDLHLVPASNATLNDLGTPIALVTSDIDGNTRSATTPDMGADEFTPPTCVTAVGGTTSSNITICGSGTLTATASGYSSGINSTYQWYSSTNSSDYPNAGTAVSGQTNPTTLTVGSAITTTTYYWLRVGCTSDASTANSNMFTATVVPSVANISPSTASICLGQSITLTENGGTSTTWSWSSSGGTNASATFSPTSTTTYSVTVTNVGLCTQTVSITVTVNSLPNAITSNATPSTICLDEISNLTSSGGAQTSVATLGTGTLLTTASTTTSALGPNPLQSYYGGAKQQMLILASELTSLGFTNGTILSSIAFDLGAVESRTLLDYTVKIQHSALTSFTSTSFVTTGFTTVRNAASYTPVSGWNTIPFNSNFTWDGSSNLLIEINFSNNDGGGTGTNTARYSTTSFASTLFYRADNATSAAVSSAATASFSAYSQRNNMRFNYTTPSNITWTPTASLYTNAAATIPYTGSPSTSSVYAKPTASEVYTVTATSSAGCSATTTVSLTVNARPTVTANASPTIVTSGNSSTITASGASTYAWTDSTFGGTLSSLTSNPSIASPVATSTYTVTGTGSNGCTNSATVTVAFSTFNISGSSTNITCNAQNDGSISVSGAGGTLPYTYTISPNLGNQFLAGEFSDLPPGTYTITGTDGASATKTIAFTLTEPTAISATTSTLGVTCFGDSSGSAVAIASGGTPFSSPTPFNYIYDWYDVNTNTIIVNDSVLSNVPAGMYYVNIEDANGCIDTFMVTITEPAQIIGSESATICDFNAPYVWLGNNYSTTGTYIDTAIAANGCDSIVTLNLIVNSSSSPTTLNLSGCVSVNLPSGATVTSSGTYPHTYTNSVSCDSVVNYVVTINQPSAPTSVSLTGCSQVTLPNSAVITSTGSTVVHYTNAAGCDSTVTYNVTINQPSTPSIVTLSGCVSITLPNSTVVTSSGSSTIFYTNSVNCDSIVTYIYTINQPSAPSTVSLVGCVSVTLPNSTVITTSGSTTVHYTNAVGCDSAVTYNVTINQPSAPSSVSMVGCVSVTLPNSAIITTSGSTTVHYTNAVGCDSAVTYNVTINQPSAPSSVSLVGCISVTLPNSTVISTSGLTTVHYTNVVGCDSAVTYNVTINQPSAPSSVSLTGCVSVTLPNAAVITSSGTTVVTYTNAVACDSVVTYNVTINQPSAPSSVSMVGCVSVTLPNATVITSTGSTVVHYTNAVGCDSAVTYNVTINQPSAPSSVALSGCISVTLPNSTVISTSGATTVHYTNAVGCDSAVTYNVTINQPSSPSSVSLVGCVSVTLPNAAVITTSGSTAVTYTNAVGCDSVVTYNVTINQPSAPSTVALSGCASVTLPNSVVITTSGSTPITYSNAVGCDSVVTYNVTINPLPSLTLTASSLNIALGDTSILTASGASGSYLFIDSSSTSTMIVTASNTAAVYPVVNTTYTVIGTNTTGCTSSATITIVTFGISTTQTDATCFGQADGSITASANSGTAPYAYSINPNVGDEFVEGEFTSLPAGVYTITGIDASSSVSTVTVTIGQPSQLVGTINVVGPSCNGGTNGYITVVGSGGTPFTPGGTINFLYLYDWYDINANQIAFDSVLTGFASGIYEVHVEDANGCITTISNINLTEPAVLDAAATASPILCNGGTTVVTVAATGGTTPYAGVGTFTVTAGTYTYTVTDVNGCTSFTTITLTEPSALVATVAGTTPILCNGGNSIVTVSGSGGTGTLSGTGTFTVTAGSYTYTVTDVNGCTAQTTVTITQPTAVTASATATAILCNGGNSIVTVSGSGGTGTLSGTGTFTVTAGSYTYTVTDANGCTAQTTITITQPTAVTASATATAILCNGGNSIVTVSGSGGTGALSGTGTFTVTAGSYTYTVTDANGCTAQTTITITQPTAVSASASATAILCNGGNSIVTVSGNGGTGTLSGTGTFTVTAGSYTYTVTDANGCTAQTTITITQPTAVTASASATAILCNGGNSIVTVSGSGGTGTLSGTGTFTVTAGSYTYTVTDANGCTKSTTITITQPTAVAASASATAILCNGGNSIVTVSGSGGTGTLSGTGTFTVTAGSYTYTVTDVNGCTAQTTITITQPTAVTASASATAILCNGGNSIVTVIGSGGTGALSGTGTFTVTAGSYTYTVTDANGCTKSTTITITQPTAVTASATATAILCNGGNSIVTVSGNGGTGTLSGTGTFTVTAGSYTYTVTDANGCTKSTTITITQPTAVTASATATAILCNGGNSIVTVSGSGGTGTLTGTGTFTVTAGTYTYTVSDANGCTKSTTITITQPTSVTASASATAILCNGGNSIVTVSGSGGTGTLSGTGTFTVTAGSYTYTVTDANGCTAQTTITITQPTSVTASASATAILCNGGNSIVTVSGSGGTGTLSGTGTFTVTAGSYTYTVTDANGCTAQSTVIITQPTAVTASASATAILCNGGNSIVTVSGSGGTGTLSGTGTFTVTAGSYTYTVTDANGCTAQTTITITQPTAVTASASATSILCNGGNSIVTVSGSGGTGTLSGAGTFTVTAGSYTYTVTDANGCTAQTTVTITQPTAVTASATATAILCNGGNSIVTVSGSGGTGALSGTGTFTVTAGSYTYTVTDVNGCTAQTTITVTQPSAVTASISASTNILCNGSSTGSATVVGSGGTLPIIAGNLTITHSSPSGQWGDEITYTLRDASNNAVLVFGPFGNGTTATSTAVPAINPPYKVEIEALGTFNDNFANWSVKCGATVIANGCIKGAANGLTCASVNTLTVTGLSCSNATTYTYLWSDGQTTATASGLAAGSYTATVTDGNGCSSTTAVTITQPTAVTASATATAILCNGGNSIVTVSGSGGTGALSGTGTFTVTAGSYTYTVTDANGCTAQTTITITQPTAVTASANATAILCNGGNSIVTVSGNGGTGTLSGTGTFTVTAGSYTYTVTDANGCSAQTTITITQPTAVTASASATAILCNGGNSIVTVSGSGGTGVLSGTGTFTVTAGSYTYTVTDANGCTAQTSISVTQPALIATTLPVTSCDSATLPWGQVVTSTGVYTHIYQAANTCDSVVTANVTINYSASTTFSVTAVLTYTLPWGQTVTSSGTYTNMYQTINSCDSLVTANINITGAYVCTKVLLSGPYNVNTGLMNDDLRGLGLVPLTEPYSSVPYNAVYTHVAGGGGETTSAAVLSVTGSNAIVDWVFVQLRSKNDDKVVLATRSALVQRDGDVVDVDGVSPLFFPNVAQDQYYVSIKHRNHTGVMTLNKYVLNGALNCIDFTSPAVPLYSRPAPSNNPTPLTGPTRIQGAVRTLYAGNCNIDLLSTAYRFISYNALPSSDRTALFNTVGGTSTLNGYHVWDVDMNGFARFNGLTPDRLVIFQNCQGSTGVYINEQTPN